MQSLRRPNLYDKQQLTMFTNAELERHGFHIESENIGLEDNLKARNGENEEEEYEEEETR